VCRAARVGGAVGHAWKIGRQLGAKPAAEDRNDDVALRRFRDLRLKRVVRPVELALPADRGQPRHALEFAVEALRHPVEATTLEPRVARRRHEYADLPTAFRHARPNKNLGGPSRSPSAGRYRANRAGRAAGPGGEVNPPTALAC